ncbi:hypothetical protein GCM10011487_11760 [Steroidobacter agaridevorans]|uniref:Uncharacterized protein n=1 Tax=Steroidobacter agaridevorans TaxID=2695856 RepID=A0A829Y8T7_9GAMM|nr:MULTISPECIES: hypothetical protein [Steroidobacteraceae]GFE79176.1 hypothetical protein GCM10011487_11760 [Steroidobacter agaridevorans]
MDPKLSSLTVEQLQMVEEQLSRDSSSTNIELQSQFVQCGLTPEQAEQVLIYRQLYLEHLYLDGHTPILKGEQAIRFNPNRQPLELMTG